MKYVLSIDGGGIRGLIPAIVCKEIESLTDTPIYKIFDLFAGTSTGGILALGLASGLDASSLFELYKNESKSIFSKTDPLGVYPLFRPKYDSKGIGTILEKTFKNKRLSDVDADVIVTSYDLSRRMPLIFSSFNAIAGSNEDYLLSELASATSAAPTFFRPVCLDDKTAVDGGLFCNNPALVAYIHAKNQWPNERIQIISLGTGSLTTSIPYKKAKKWGKINGIIPILECVFDGVNQTTDNVIAKMARIDSYNLVYQRLQCTLDPSCEKMDNISDKAIENLKRIGKNLADDNNEFFREFINLRNRDSSYSSITLDENSKYLRYGTGDIVLSDLKSEGINMDHIKIKEGFTINDLLKVCINTHKKRIPENEIREKVYKARAHAFSIKYSEPKEDEKLIFPDEILVQNLRVWTDYLHEILTEKSVSINDMQIIDVGAGHSQANINLYKNIKKITLVDVSKVALKIAKDSLSHAETIVANAEDLSIIDKKYNLYLSFRTYQSTLFDYRAALHEAYRILNRRGIFIISIPIMFPKEDGSIAKGLLRPGNKEIKPDMCYANEVASSIASTAQCLQFNNVSIDDRSPFELFIIGER